MPIIKREKQKPRRFLVPPIAGARGPSQLTTTVILMVTLEPTLNGSRITTHDPRLVRHLQTSRSRLAGRGDGQVVASATGDTGAPQQRLAALTSCLLER